MLPLCLLTGFVSGKTTAFLCSLHLMWSFTLAVFNIVSFSLVLNNMTMMGLDVVLFMFPVFKVAWIHLFIFFIKFGNILAIISTNNFSVLHQLHNIRPTKIVPDLTDALVFFPFTVFSLFHFK